MTTPTPILETRSLTLEIAGQRICQTLSLSVHAGECLGVLGQNGTGKTTLLHTLARLRNAQGGEILLMGKNMNAWSRKALATHLGVLFQNTLDSMPASVEETVMMGRHPHLPDWQWESAKDIAVARDALNAVNLSNLAERDVSTLSGGERQRLALAMLLAQEPQLYLLDEPGNHLDIAFQVKSLQLLREHVGRRRAALCMATHDINLAARFCDRVLLLMGGGEYLMGPANEVLTPESLSLAYGCRIGVVEAGGRKVFFPE